MFLKVEYMGTGCGYTGRVTSKWVKGLCPPGCPKHGPLKVDLPAADEGLRLA